MARTKSILSLAGLCLAGVAGAGAANAGCLDLNSLKPAGALTPAVFHPDSPASAFFRLIDDRDRDSGPPSIVGMWKFKFSASLGGDFGTLLWHPDGTEIMISAARDPAAGDVCMGVWKQTGRYTYELNHIAMGHDGPPGGPPSPTFTNTVHLHEYIKLDPAGNSYTGHIDAVISAANPVDPFDESNVMAQVSGTITATRVTP